MWSDEKGVESPSDEALHYRAAPRLGNSDGCPLGWHNGVSQPMPSPLGAALAICRGQMLRSLVTSKPRELQPCNDCIASLSSLGCTPRRSRPSPPPTRPSRLCAAPPVPGEQPVHLAPLVPGPCALVATPPGAQLPARALPETLKWSGLSSAQRTTLSNCFPFYSQAGS